VDAVHVTILEVNEASSPKLLLLTMAGQGSVVLRMAVASASLLWMHAARINSPSRLPALEALTF
jgi:hypothetical protein